MFPLDWKCRMYRMYRIESDVSVPALPMMHGAPSEGDVESLSMYGYFPCDSINEFLYERGAVRSSVVFNASNGRYSMSVECSGSGRRTCICNGIDGLIGCIAAWQDGEVYAVGIPHGGHSYIEAKRKINKGGRRGGKETAWDYTQNMQRVKSSNIYSYSMRVHDGSDKGDLFIQFKNRKGGPGDIYQYFDFPIRLWRKFVATGSKGHFFWRYIRNNFLYRKLTGDRRGKLPNAVN